MLGSNKRSCLLDGQNVLFIGFDIMLFFLHIFPFFPNRKSWRGDFRSTSISCLCSSTTYYGWSTFFRHEEVKKKKRKKSENAGKSTEESLFKKPWCVSLNSNQFFGLSSEEGQKLPSKFSSPYIHLDISLLEITFVSSFPPKSLI